MRLIRNLTAYAERQGASDEIGAELLGGDPAAIRGHAAAASGAGLRVRQANAMAQTGARLPAELPMSS